jgi:hypothetical protein
VARKRGNGRSERAMGRDVESALRRQRERNGERGGRDDDVLKDGGGGGRGGVNPLVLHTITHDAI